mgnify:CR=1 FL=1
MTQVCKVCNHQKRREIERLLVQNRSITAISRKYDIPRDSLTRHRKNHLSWQLVKAQETRDLFVSKNMYNLINDLLNSSLNILKKTENDPKKYGIALKAVAESRKTVEFLFEVSISLQQIQHEEERQKLEQAEQEYDLSRLTEDELELFVKLSNKLRGIEQGKRNDRLLTKRQHEKNQEKLKIAANRRYREKKKANSKSVEPTPQPFKLKRRKIEPKPEPENEFDQMRERLGLSNNPEPPKPTSWM